MAYGNLKATAEPFAFASLLDEQLRPWLFPLPLALLLP